MNKTIRIRTDLNNDKNITLNLEQEFDFLEILSLKIKQEDVYRSFSSKHGVIVGRVIANSGFGVPNAKVSIFIPLKPEDENNEFLKTFYPYKNVNDKNFEGYRYNLLSNYSNCDLVVPVGTFPSKDEVLDNDVILEIYDKYYKFTTKTNQSGDYMIFGVPVGEQIVHMDVDLSDIDFLSVRPYEMIDSGYPKNLFKNSKEFKKSTNLSNLPQLKTQNKSVYVVPFWGDEVVGQIGINRVDFDIDYEFKPISLLIGSYVTDDDKNSINKNCMPNLNQGTLCNLKTGAATIEALKIVYDIYNNPIGIEDFDFINGSNFVDEDGSFVIQIPMYYDRKITDEYGNLVPSYDENVGIPTKADIRFKIKSNEPSTKRLRRTATMIFPSIPRDLSMGGDVNSEQQRWAYNLSDYGYSTTNPGSLFKDFKRFEWKQVYSVASFIRKYKTKPVNPNRFLGFKDIDGCDDKTPIPYNNAIFNNNIIFTLLSFFIDITFQFLRVLIFLSSFRYTIYIKLLGNCFTINLGPFLPGIPFSLSCESDNTVSDINTRCTGSIAPPCNSQSGLVSIDIFNPSLSQCPQPDPNSSGDYCAELCKLLAWRCCIKLDLALKYNVIQKAFVDDWLVGTMYLPQYKVKNRNNGKTKLCASGGDGRGADRYLINSNANDFNECVNNGFCRVRVPYKNPITNRFLTQIDDQQTNGIDWNATSVIQNGADDIDDHIYCNKAFPTNIINIGRLDFCQDVLKRILLCIDDPNCNFIDKHKFGNFQQKIGVGAESGFDVIQWTRFFRGTSYNDSTEILLFIFKEITCGAISGLFTGPLGCYGNELKFEPLGSNPQIYMREASKLYVDDTNEIHYDINGNIISENNPSFSQLLSYSVLDGNTPFSITIDLKNRFSPYGSNNPNDLNQYGYVVPEANKIDKTFRYNLNPKALNYDYYYFGLTPGKTAMDKIIKDYFNFV
jgi:hypothetical protein